MSARYLLTITDEDAARLEKWLGGALIIGPAHLQREGAACFVAGLDAITEVEAELIARRLSAFGPVYHAGGPAGDAAHQESDATFRSWKKHDRGSR
jgi:hypothetical protein